MIESNKVCRRCKENKPRTEFNKASREKDGLQDRCRQCNKIVSAEYRAAHPEKERSRHAEYHEKNKEKINERVSEWQKKNPEKVRAKAQKYYHNNRKKVLIRMKQWQLNNPEWIKNYAAKWCSENKGWRKEYDAEYQKINAHKVNARNRKYIAIKKQAMPSWADEQKILEFYVASKQMTQETGIEYHVDHIVPLTSKIVCGLHWEGNLQILTEFENIKKGNRRWPDSP